MSRFRQAPVLVVVLLLFYALLPVGVYAQSDALTVAFTAQSVTFSYKDQSLTMGNINGTAGWVLVQNATGTYQSYINGQYWGAFHWVQRGNTWKLTIYGNAPAGFSCKIAVSGNLQSAYRFLASSDGMLWFDWSDARQYFSFSGGFVILSVPTGLFSIDPTVGTSMNVQYTTNDATNVPTTLKSLTSDNSYVMSMTTPVWSGGYVMAQGGGANGISNPSMTAGALQELSTAGTVAVWVKPNQTMQEQGGIVGLCNTASGGRAAYVLFVAGSVVRASIFNSTFNSVSVITSTAVSTMTNDWNLLSLGWNSTYMWVGLNTSLTYMAIPASFINVTWLSGTFQWGGDTQQNGWDRAIAGYVVNGLIYGRNITAVELALIYNAGPTPSLTTIPSPNDFSLWFPMDEGSGNSVYGYGTQTSFVAQGTPQTLTIAQNTTGINSKIYWFTPSFPYVVTALSQQYALLNGGATSWRVNNSATQTLALYHQFYLYLSVYPLTAGTLSHATGWYNATQLYNFIATTLTGYTFESWYNNGSVAYALPIYPFTVAGPNNLVAFFTVAPGMSLDSIYWGVVFFYVFLLVMSILIISFTPLRRFLVVLIFAFFDILYGLANLTISSATLPVSPWSEMMMIVLGGIMLFVAANAKPTIPGKHP